MKLAATAALLFFACTSVAQAAFRAAKPRYAQDAHDGRAFRPSGYRNAWDDCGGVGASATERMRMIAAKIKGWAKPLPLVRHAAQDCGMKNKYKFGTKPGPFQAVNYPAAAIPKAAREGLEKAAETLKMYPVAAKKKAEYVGYLYNDM